jgi:integrase
MKPKKFYNKKEKKEQWRCRFQLHNREYRLVADSRGELLELVEEIRMQERRAKNGLPTVRPVPELAKLLARHQEELEGKPELRTFSRAARLWLDLLDKKGYGQLLTTELARAHLQMYLDARLREIKPESANREMTSLAAALHQAAGYYPELEKWICPKIPREKVKRRRRERLITAAEVEKLLAYLYAPEPPCRPRGLRPHHYAARQRLGHALEFTLHTGLRRKECAGLKKSQYDATRRALIDVQRWKTGTVTKFFPLTTRAVEIVEARLQLQPDGEYLFTPNGKPIAGHYHILRRACEKLGLNYGALKDGGFVMHDARHNFATAIIKTTDIETARELTGHTGEEILTYLHTGEDDLRRAVAAFEGADVQAELRALWEDVRNGAIGFEKFAETVKNMPLSQAGR